MVPVMNAVCVFLYVHVKASNGVGGKESGAFGVGVEVHRGSVLDPLLFIVVLEALFGGTFVEGLPVGLLYADGLVLVAAAGELLLERVR